MPDDVRGGRTYPGWTPDGSACWDEAAVFGSEDGEVRAEAASKDNLLRRSVMLAAIRILNGALDST